MKKTKGFWYTPTYGISIEGRRVEEHFNGDHSVCNLHFDWKSTRYEMPLPLWLCPPKVEKIYPKSWSEEDCKRLGRNYYDDYTTRKYGFSYWDGLFMIYYGLVTHDSSTDQNKGWFLPWIEQKFEKTEILDYHDFSVYGIEPVYEWNNDDERCFHDLWMASIPKFRFEFKETDGTPNSANCHISRRYWTRGTKWCSFLKYFYPKFVRTDLNLEFEVESGRGRGSWKGGTLSAGMMMRPDETIFQALQRYLNDEGIAAPISETHNYYNLFTSYDEEVYRWRKVHEDGFDTESVAYHDIQIERIFPIGIKDSDREKFYKALREKQIVINMKK